MADLRLATTLARILAADPHAARGSSDAELLTRFCDGRDEASFAALVDRHGAMVLGVARGVLGDRHNAEDVCQATFLVLARNAGSVRERPSLAAWLHGVAYRVALAARRAAARRRAHERRADAPRPADPAEVVAWREIGLLLGAEVDGLPETFRGVLVLCCLECRGRAEVARRLGLAEGTVWSRLAEARARLRRRLARQGVTAPTGRGHA